MSLRLVECGARGCWTRTRPSPSSGPPSRPESTFSTPQTSTSQGEERAGHRKRAEGIRQAPRGGDRHQGQRADGRRRQNAASRASTSWTASTEPEAAGRRLCRPLPDPPLRLRHADRGDAGGAERRRARRQGPLHRRKLDVRLAVHEDAGRLEGPTAGRPSSPCSRSTTWSIARRSARCCRSAARGRRRHPLVAAGARVPGRRPRSAAKATPSAPAPTSSRRGSITASPTSRGAGVDEVAKARGVPNMQVALAWVLATRPSPRPSSARPKPTTWTTRSAA